MVREGAAMVNEESCAKGCGGEFGPGSGLFCFGFEWLRPVRMLCGGVISWRAS